MRRLLALLVVLLGVPVAAQTQASLRCTVINTSTATLVKFVATAACPATPSDAQTAFFITDITASSSVIGSTTADEALELKYGTGTNCGTGTTVLWAAFNLALAPIHASFRTPLKVPGGSDLCWMHAGTGNKTFIVTGYQGPQ
jgi:hypothetical protein